MTRVAILGAAGRDFHVFNVAFRDDARTHVVCFTAAQIPGIAGRRYPRELAGPGYPQGIPMEPEDELERVIAEHPDVALVAVGSVPDEAKGELAKAYVVPRQGAQLDLEQLEQHCRERLAAYKVPRAFKIVEDLPKTSTGKILRRMLKTLDA